MNVMNHSSHIQCKSPVRAIRIP